jgi:hypothetical protein
MKIPPVLQLSSLLLLRLLHEHLLHITLNISSSGSEMKQIRALLETLVQHQNKILTLGKPPKGARTHSITNPCGIKSAFRSSVIKLLSNSLSLYWNFFNNEVFPAWWIDQVQVCSLFFNINWYLTVLERKRTLTKDFYRNFN